MQEDILMELQHRLPELSKGQKRIAQYLIDGCEKAAFLTAGALGKAAQVSESTVVRFAKDLGFEGYPQMQKQLQEYVLRNLTAAQRMDLGAQRMQRQDLLSAVFEEDRERIRLSAEQLDRQAFEGAAGALLRARRIYLLGARSSAALAVFAAHYFGYLFEDVRLVQPDAIDQLVSLRQSDAVLAISFPRYCASTVEALRYARRAGAETIVLTDAPTSPLAPLAEHLLLAKSDMVWLVDSLVAPMSLLNGLIVTVAERRKKELTSTFQKLETIWDLHHVYEKHDE